MEQEELSVLAVAKYLHGLKLPAGKAEIIRSARRNDAHDDIVHVLHRLPAVEYAETDDIWRALNKIIQG